jgi:uncharacterized membrane protein YqjE
VARTILTGIPRRGKLAPPGGPQHSGLHDRTTGSLGTNGRAALDLRTRIATRITDIRDRGQRLVQLNLELLAAELKEKGRKFGAAIGLFVAAGLFSLYAIGFLLATIAVVIAIWLPTWAALLIVTVLLFVLVAILVLVGRDQFRKIGDPKPEAAIAEAKATADMLKANARGTVSGVGERLRPKRPEAPPVPPEPPLPGWSSSPPPSPSGPATGSGEAARPPAAGTGSAGPSSTGDAPAAAGPTGDDGQPDPEKEA